MKFDYFKEFDGSVTVCDKAGIVVYCNDRASAQYGNMTGKSLKQCHQPASWEKICRLMETGESNSYSIEKQGVKKMIYHTPWREGGEVKGVIELSFVVPESMPHHVRG